MSGVRAIARWVGPAAVAALLITCDGNDSGTEPVPAKPTPGWLLIRLTTPNADDGGISFTVTGVSVDSIRSAHPHLITRRESTSTVRAIVAGNIAGGVIAEIYVPDTRQSAQYAATVQEVAARSTFAQRQATAYSLSVAP